MLRSPIRYIGGKGNMVNKLLKFIPNHKIYVEVFGGGASLLFAKKPSKVEVYNDIDGDLVNFFRVLRDKEKFEEFYRKVCLTPYSREEFYFCRDTYKECKDEVERAYRWFVMAKQSFCGDIGKNPSWGYVITTSSRNIAKIVLNWLSTIEMLPEIHQRLMIVQIENDDFRKIIPRYDTEETFFYLDPPYVPETRKGGGYKYEMSLEDHKELVDILLKIKGKALLSGYKHDVYRPLEENGWIRIEINTACYAVGRTRFTKILGKNSAKLKQPRTECLWLNYGKKCLFGF